MDEHPVESGIPLRRSAKVLAVVAFVVVVGTVMAVEPLRAHTAPPVADMPAGIKVPLGIPADVVAAMIPVDNPMTPQKIELGRELFFDKRLSDDRTVSCATCHDPAIALTTADPVSIGIRNQKTARNAPTVFNSMFNELQFWDGRAVSLEEQSKGPLTNPLEMGMKDHDAVVARVKSITEYAPKFTAVFGSEGITIDTVAKAIAAFERTQLSGNAPFDRFMAGDAVAISASAKRGWDLFNGKARCISCHAWNPSSPFFTDYKFHNVGVAAKDRNFTALAREALRVLQSNKNLEATLDELALREGTSELGRFLITRQPRDIGAFKTPTLRDIELTAPYFHNGSEKTLLDAVNFYDKGGEPNPNLDGGIRKLSLTDAEKADLVEFLKTLTSDDVRGAMLNQKPQTREPAR
ncbi:MAG: c-type cytochrome [Blastocatellia bacterium]|nr:c-type cytochrome [Blastocatellia bacterium]